MHDDGEYENLPFHGMQSPPSKVIHFVRPIASN